MKKNILSLVLMGVFLAGGTLFQNSVNAQEWSAAQKEVWKVENDCWTQLAKGDLAGFLEFFHADYMGWDDNSPMPSSKADVQKWFQAFMQGSKNLFYDIKPVGIKVFGDFAMVDYYYSLASEVDGKKKMEDGRWTDILMKQGGKWLLIGDNGGANAKKHED